MGATDTRRPSVERTRFVAPSPPAGCRARPCHLRAAFRLAVAAGLAAGLGWLSPVNVHAQGCSAIRSSGSAGLPGVAVLPSERGFQASLSYRYLYADRYFVGSEELPMPPGSQVINEIHTFDVSLSYAVNARLNFTLDLPVLYGERTTRHEHLGMTGPQFTTRAFGIGDLRFSGNYWMLDPARHCPGNIALGIGLKAPTGDDSAEDDFHTADGIQQRPVDVAIQPGDGGWGFLVQMQAYHQIAGQLSAYADGMYLFNPEHVNGTPSFSPPGSPNRDDVNSIPDQYYGRVGLNYVVWPKAGLSLSVGGRIEGIPARDIIGPAQGFRRPSFVVSIEPGLSWNLGKNSFSLTAPVALLRNRERSVTDDLTGTHGDASFADYLIFANFTRRF